MEEVGGIVPLMLIVQLSSFSKIYILEVSMPYKLINILSLSGCFKKYDKYFARGKIPSVVN